MLEERLVRLIYTNDRLMPVGQNEGEVYELTRKDISAIEAITEKRKKEGSGTYLFIGSWRKKIGKDDYDYSEMGICKSIIHLPEYKEYYEALDKIKPFSEREIVEVMG